MLFPVMILGKAISIHLNWWSYPARIMACALTMAAFAPALQAQPAAQSVTGDCTFALHDLKDVQIGNVIVTCIGEVTLAHLAEGIAKKRPDLLSTDDKEKLKLLRSTLGLAEGALEGFFRILGEEDIPPEKLAQRLTQIAEDYRKLREQITSLGPDDPDLNALRDQAIAVIEAGRLDDARDLLIRIVQARKPRIAMAQKLLIETAEAEAALEHIAVLQRRYLEAAGHFRSASDVLLGGQVAKRRDYREAEADASYREGGERGNKEAAAHTIALYRALLQETDRKRVPLGWAMTQANLGIALATLGERESGMARLEEAIDAYRAALQERIRGRVPLAWARTQNNLGTVLTKLDERESGSVRLEPAVAAYCAALEVLEATEANHYAASAQGNLANVQGPIGKRTTRASNRPNASR